MERLTLTCYKLNHLTNYKLSRNVIATEAKTFYYPEKNKWIMEMKALKFFYKGVDTSKLNNLEYLEQNKNLLEKIKSLIIPEKIVSVDNVDRGITMPFVENYNLADILKFRDLDDVTKFNFLKQVGNALDELHILKRNNSSLSNFALSDLHEANVIIDIKTDDIKIIDLDSSYTGGAIFPSKYLSGNTNLDNISHKYIKKDDKIIPNDQTDLYCYHMMILNYLYGGNVSKLPQDEFYYYLEYLKMIGANEDFLDSCLRLYMNKENINPKDFIEDLAKIAPRATKKFFEVNKGRIHL